MMSIADADTTSDVVFLESLSVSAVVGLDAWGRESRPQPVLLDVRVYTDLLEAGGSDDVGDTINYGTLCKSITSTIESMGPSSSLLLFVHAVCDMALRSGGWKAEVTVTLPKGLLLAEGIGISVIATEQKDAMETNEVLSERQTFFVKNLQVPCIIGVNALERIHKQHVVVNLAFLNFDEELLKGRLYITLMSRLSRVSVKSHIPMITN